LASNHKLPFKFIEDQNLAVLMCDLSQQMLRKPTIGFEKFGNKDVTSK
jgi:hypothetical protein